MGALPASRAGAAEDPFDCDMGECMVCVDMARISKPERVRTNSRFPMPGVYRAAGAGLSLPLN